MEKEILQEIKEKRSLRSKHFLKKDGTFVAHLYNDDVHYVDNGEFKDIDNTLIKKGNRFENTANDFKVSFANASEDNLLELTKDNKKLTMGLKNSKRKLCKRKAMKDVSPLIDEIDYPNILNNIDLEYIVLPKKIKEAIILKNKDAISENLIFTINYPNMELILNDDKTISIIEANAEKFKIEAPYMVDNDGNSNYNISYEILNNNEIKLLLDEDWLKTEDRQYPVTIDPTIIVNTGLVSDSEEVNLTTPSNITVNSDVLCTGVGRFSNQNYTFRSLLKFPLDELKAGDEIISADLYLYSNPDPLFYTKEFFSPVAIHRVTTDWSASTANWNNMSNNYDSTIESFSDYIGTFNNGLSSLVPNSNIFDITTLVKKWYDGVPNYGIMLKSLEEKYHENSSEMAFLSRNAGINQQDGVSPRIVIEYRNQNGVEPYLTYQTQKFQNMNVHVNNISGNLTAIYNILNTKSNKLPLVLQLIYNTNDKNPDIENKYGNGWRLNFAQELSIDDNNIKYIDEDGTAHYFRKKQEHIYDEDGDYLETIEYDVICDEDGLSLTLEKVNEDWIMSDSEGNKSKFIVENDKYYLSEIEDVEGNKIVITRTNGKITSIIDGKNEAITINYNDNTIEFISNEKTVIATVSNNNIVSIDNDTIFTSFIYNANNTIDKIVNGNGKSVGYEYYDKASRVKKIIEYGINNEIGNTLELSYGFQTTTIIDSKGKYNTYTFNDLGNAISMSNLASREDVKDAYGKSSNFGEYGDYKNKLMLDNQLVKSVNNYIVNSSFEIDENSYLSPHYDVGGFEWGVTEENARTGKKSLKIESLPFSEYNYFYREIQVPKGKFYTFSAYIKANSTGKGIRLGLRYNLGVAYSDYCIKNDDYERYSVTIFYGGEDYVSDLRYYFEVDSTHGDFYIDDIQLEEGQVANLYNLVNNSDFSYGLAHWNNSVDDGVTNNDEIITLSNGKNAYKMKCYPLHQKELSTTFDISGKDGDVYYLSFWYKNTGIMGNNPWLFRNCVLLRFNYINIPEDEGFGIQEDHVLLNSNSSEWQFFSTTISANRGYDYDGISLEFLSICNANELIITNVSLFKDLGGNSYSYDENGNISTIFDTNKQLSEFKYNNSDQLESLISPSGYNLKYEYDKEIITKLLKGISQTGISNEIIYNDNNLPITSLFTNRNNSSEIEENKFYYIRAKGTNKYLKFNPINSSIVLIDKKDVYGQVKFNKIEENKYTINSKAFNQFVYHINNEIKYAPNNTEKRFFEIIKNNNGTVSIKLYNTEDQYLSLENDILTISDNSDEFYLEEIKQLLFVESSIEYTSNENFINKTIDSLGNSTTYKIEETGLIDSMTDSKGNTTEYEYNNSKQISKIINNNQNVEYIYDNKYSLSQILHGTKNYNFLYDEFLNIIRVNINNNILIENIYEENNGNLIELKYGNGHEIKYVYDEFDRTSELIKSDNIYTYRYDNLGNIKRIESNDGVTECEYDLSGRIVEIKNNKDFVVKYKYDNNSNIKEKIIDSNKYNYEFNKENILSKISYDNNEINYNYDEIGRLTTISYNNIYNINYDYITKGNKTCLLVQNVIDNYDNTSYEYDELNNITKIFKDDILTKEYVYDEYNQLIKDFDYSKNTTVNYTYDNVGNIQSKSKYSIDNNQLLDINVYEYNNPNWEDQLTKFNDEIISYDSIGNPVSIGDKELSWVNGRELNLYTDSNQRIEYKYNENGIRTSKIINEIETKYYLEGNKIIYEDRDGEALYYLYDNTGNLIGFKTSTNNIYYYTKNLQSDIIGLLDEHYNLIAQYDYDSFGSLISVKDEDGNYITNGSHIAIVNPFRYRSYYYDTDTNLYYLNSRYYNPVWGRFINADGIGGANKDILSQNLYAYCSNNSTNFKDPSGKGFIDGLGEFLESVFQYGIDKTEKETNIKIQNPVKTRSKKRNATTDAIVKIIANSKVSYSIVGGGEIGKAGWEFSYGGQVAPNSGLNKKYFTADTSMSYGKGLPVYAYGNLDIQLGLSSPLDLLNDDYAYYCYTGPNSGGNIYATRGAVRKYDIISGEYTYSPDIGVSAGVNYTWEWDVKSKKK